MRRAVDYVRLRGGKDVPNREVCRAVNPSPYPEKCEGAGYDPVNRAVAAGLLVRTYARNGSLLSLPDAVLNEGTKGL